jgi:5-methylcytosine-specific restriction protein A
VVLVSVRQQDLEHGTGVGHIDGLDIPVSLRAVKQLVCGGGSQHAVINAEGRVISLGTPNRIFNSSQRRAITLRDGGCLITECHIPANWCEIHHVNPAMNDGPTHTDNGVLLCWFHHHTIDSSGWLIRMNAGVPEIKAPEWLDHHGRHRPATTSGTRLSDELDARRTNL